MNLDASTLGIVWARLIALVDEASAALVRAAFSPVVRESHDFSCVVTDASGALLAQATSSIPSFIATLPRTVRHVAKALEGKLVPGDVIITNDPWLGTGHLPDINMVRPIFVGKNLVGFAASVAHATDIGGRSDSVVMRDVFEEGLQIPPLHFIRGGQGVDETLMAMIRANVRTPDEVGGDLFAMLAGLEVIDTGVAKLLGEYGLVSLLPFAQELFARSSAAMEKAIAAVPEGDYHVQSVVDAVSPELRFTTSVRFSKARCSISFSDVPAQLQGSSINSVLAYTQAYALYALKCALLPELPNNDGLWHHVNVEAPEGSVLNHSFPASGLMRHYLGHEVASSVMTALAQAVPQRATAASGSAPLWSISLTSPPVDGRSLNQLFFFNGGIGASKQRDGDAALSWPSNVAGLPVELMERFAPVRVLSKRLRKGSGGVGSHCGGDGLEVSFEMLPWPSPVTLTFNGGRLRVPATGVLGGSAGALGEFSINDERVDPYHPHLMRTGDRFTVSTPGGGGFGGPSPSSKTACCESNA
jgi:N-methylhydantoinase B